jgi:hypothetical protein
MSQPLGKLKIIYRAHKGALIVPAPSRLNSLRNASFHHTKTYFSIILVYKRRFQSVFSPNILRIKILNALLMSLVYSTLYSHQILLQLITPTCDEDLKSKIFSSCSFLLSPSFLIHSQYFLFLQSDVLRLIWQKTAGEITILGVLVYMFLGVNLDANVNCQNYTSRDAMGFILV